MLPGSRNRNCTGTASRSCLHARMADEVQALMAILQRTTAWFEERGIDNARREAEWIFAETLQLERMELYTRFDMPIDGDELILLRERVQRRGRREPLAYVLGTQPFCGLTLRCDARALVPRPETEELVERVVRIARQRPAGRLVDVGTGSGAIALACAAALPDWEVVGTDCSAAALELARDNAAAAGLDVAFQQGHLCAATPGPWDLVVANLPYIAEAERSECDPELAFEPAEALYAGEHGLALIADLIVALPNLLAATGEAWCEHGWQQGGRIVDLAEDAGLTARIHQDLAGRDRYAQITRGPR